MKERNKKMNGFQGIASVIYALSVIGTVTAFGTSTDAAIIIPIFVISETILFYFMYALGEIVKQLRISNEMFYDNEEK